MRIYLFKLIRLTFQHFQGLHLGLVLDKVMLPHNQPFLLLKVFILYGMASDCCFLSSVRLDILQRVTVLSSESVEVAWEDPNVVTTSLNIKYCINSSSQCQTITANTAYRKHEIVELQKFTTYHILIEDFSKGITVKTLEDCKSTILRLLWQLSDCTCLLVIKH